MNYMTYCWTKSGLDSCQKVGVVIAHLPAAEWKALLPSLQHETPLRGPSRRRTGSVLTARGRGQRLVPRGQGSLCWTMSYAVENSPKGCIWGGGGKLLRSVKLGLMMVSWCGVIVWRWKIQVVQISLRNCQWFLWFWKDKVCDSNKMPHVSQSLGSGLQLSLEHRTGNSKTLQCVLSSCVQTLYNIRVKCVTT